MAIGIFDSGIGGLTVLKEIKKNLPEEKLFYFGDTGRIPYGDKPKEVIIKYCIEIVEFLLTKNVDVIVIACNTATVMALDELNKIFNIPIIGVIDGGVKSALYTTQNKKIGVIGTQGTINSMKYEIELKKNMEEVKVYSKGCPLLVYAVEDGIINGKLLNEIIKNYLDFMKNEVDTLILGCTHFPLLQNEIKRIYPKINLIDPAVETTKTLKKILKDKGIENKNTSHNREIEYFVSDNIENFRKLGEKFLGEKLNFIEKVIF